MSTAAPIPSSLLGELPAPEFLRRYWQKQPLFIEAACSDYASPITADELAGLACDEHVEARLVYADAECPYRLEFGPFQERRFERLGTRDWTLLVQDVDKWVPEVAALLRRVAFIPSWRIDDIMLSIAAPGRSVGPHADSYDVFLLQVAGTRRWQVSHHFDASRLRTDTDLGVLQDFRAEREWLAKPGDVLYLPPNVAHYGVAQTECMTFSLGMRAPSDHELLRQYVQALDAGELLTSPVEQRYADPDLKPTNDPGRVDPDALKRLGRLLRGAVAQPDVALALLSER